MNFGGIHSEQACYSGRTSSSESESGSEEDSVTSDGHQYKERKHSDDFPIVRENFGKSVYRVDSKTSDEIEESGFSASDDFSAVDNLLEHENSLIVSEDMDGIKTYVSETHASGYLYEIDASDIEGASLTENFEQHRDETIDVMSVNHNSSDSPLHMSEAHINVDKLNSVRNEEGIVEYLGEIDRFNVNSF